MYEKQRENIFLRVFEREIQKEKKRKIQGQDDIEEKNRRIIYRYRYKDARPVSQHPVSLILKRTYD